MDSDEDEIHSVAEAARMTAYANALVAKLKEDRRFQALYINWRSTHGDDHAALLADVTNFKARLREFVVEQLRLTDALAELIFKDMIAFAVYGTGVEIDLPDAVHLETLEPGRRTEQREHITRRIDWYYRVRLQEPRETARSIAKQWATERGTSRSRGYVVKALKETEALLFKFKLEMIGGSGQWQ